MSWQATSWAARQTAGNSGRKALLLLIANATSPDGVTYIGRKTLADECECRPETVSANLGALEAAGLISRHQRRRRNGSRATDFIVLAPNWEDRGEMRDGDHDELPEAVADDASRGHSGKSSPEVFRGGQVRNPGSPPEKVTETVNAENAGASERVSADVRRVFDQWVIATKRSAAKTKITPDRQRRIKVALKSHGVEDCLAAVTNIGQDSWAMGHNDRGRPFNDIDHALGDAERIERWRDWKPPVPATANGNVHPIRQSNGKPSHDQLLAELRAANPRLQEQATAQAAVGEYVMRKQLAE